MQLLTHENLLLKHRNQLLAAENQQLLHQLETYQNKFTTLKSQKIHFIIKQKQQIDILIKQNIDKVRQTLAKTEGTCSELNLHLQMLNQIQTSETYTILKILFEIIDSISKTLRNQQEQDRQSKLQNISNKITMRRANLKMKVKPQNDYVHFVKDPSNSISNLVLNQRLQMEDINYIRKFYETIISKLNSNKNRICHIKLEALLNNFAQSINLRCQLKKQQANVSLIERQYEIGNISQTIINQALKNLSHAKTQLRNIKYVIDSDLNLILQ